MTVTTSTPYSALAPDQAREDSTLGTNTSSEGFHTPQDAITPSPLYE